MREQKPRRVFLLTAAALLFGAGPCAFALDTQVSTGLYYYPSEAGKLMRAQTETGEDGLEFPSPRDSRDVARELADEELRDGNVCLRQLKRDLKTSLRKWRVRELCERLFHDAAETALRDATREHLHPDHLECDASVEAREQAGELSLQLAFRAQLVMRDRAPQKLRRAGIGGQLTRWDLPVQEDTLGAVAGSWKEALKAGACAADSHALDAFWKRMQDRAAEARELAECRGHDSRDSDSVARLQKQLKEYVPEDWLEENGENVSELLEPAPVLAQGSSLDQCKVARAEISRRLEKLRSLSSRIADKHDLPVLSPAGTSGRAPASVSQDEDEEE